MAEHDLVDLTEPVWITLGERCECGQVRSYREGVLVKKAYTEFVSCSTFHLIGQTGDTILPFVVNRVTYLILAGENNHYGGISLDEKKFHRSSLSCEHHWKE